MLSISKFSFVFCILLFASINLYSQYFQDDCEDYDLSVSKWIYDNTYWENIEDAFAHSGVRVWKVNTPGQYLSIANPLNLLTASNPYLSFWIKGSPNNNNYWVLIAVNISIDGGINWFDIGSTGWDWTSTNWKRYQISLNDYKYNNVLVRIRADVNSTWDYMHIDDIIIEDAPVPRLLTLSQPTNNGMKINWTQSAATDFKHYRILVSTSDGGDDGWEDSYTTEEQLNYISGRTEHRIFTITNQGQTSLILNRDSLNGLAFVNRTYFVKLYEEDTQGFYNQGSNKASLSTAFTMGTQNVPYNQTFDSLTTPKWAMDLPWAITDEENGNPGHSSPNCISDSPNEYYYNYADINAYCKWTIPSSVTRPILKFKHKYLFENNIDMAYVYWSLDGNGWNEIGAFQNNTFEEWVESPELFIGELKQVAPNTPVFLKFRLSSNENIMQDGWKIDDISIAQNPRPNITFPVSENFEDSAQAASKWVYGFWERYENDSYSDGTYCMKLNQQYRFLTLGSPINILTAPNPYLSFWYKGSPYNDNNRTNIIIQISTDGGANWSEIGNVGWNTINTNWKRYQLSLNSFKSNNFLIRIFAYGNSTWNCMFLDDILIDNAPTPRLLTLSQPTNNGMKISWTQSTATDFKHYRILVSTSDGGDDGWEDTYRTDEQYYYVSGRTEYRTFTITNKAQTSLILNRDSLNGLAFVNRTYYVKLYEEDTLGLYNQGSEKQSLATGFSMTSQVAPFVQTFDTLATSKWAMDLPWTITDEENGIPGHSSPNCISDSPNDYYSNYTDINAICKWLIPATITRPILKFKHKYLFENNNDVAYVYWSLDGSGWDEIAQFKNNTFEEWVESPEFFIGEFKQLPPQTPVYLRFRFNSNENYTQDGWKIDDVSITQNPRPNITFPYIENFEDETQANEKWVFGMWERYENDSHSQGNNCMKVKNIAHYLTLGAPINLLNVSRPYLSFWYKGSQNNYNTYIGVTISTDGGANWTHHIGETGTTSNYWIRYQLSLNDYKYNNVLIKLYAWNNYYYWNLDYILIDDIVFGSQIELTSPYDQATNRPSNITFTWTASSTSNQYQMQLCQDPYFSSLLIDSTLDATMLSKSDLQYYTTYYWRVRGLDNETDWTPVCSFTTGDSTVINGFSQPVLISPANGATRIDTTNTVFKWYSVQTATSYRIQLSISPTFYPLRKNAVVTDTTFLLTNEFLTPSTPYYWRVRAIREDDSTDFSNANIFVTKGTSIILAPKNVNITLGIDGLWDNTTQTHKTTNVMAELRVGNDLMSSVLVSRVPAIVNSNGIAEANFVQTLNGTYWLVVRAPGYLPLGSTSQITLTDDGANYNFRSAYSQAAGGSAAMIQVGSDWLMRAGDFNQDRITSPSDNVLYIQNAGNNLINFVPQP